MTDVTQNPTQEQQFVSPEECPTFSTDFLQPLMRGNSYRHYSVSAYIHPFLFREERYWAVSNGFILHLLRDDSPLVTRDDLVLAPRIPETNEERVMAVPVTRTFRAPVWQNKQIAGLLGDLTMEEARLFYDYNGMGEWLKPKTRRLAQNVAAVLCRGAEGYQIGAFLPFDSWLLTGEPRLLVNPCYLAQALDFVVGRWYPRDVVNVVGLNPEKTALFLGWRDKGGLLQRAAVVHGLQRDPRSGPAAPGTLI